MVYSNKQFANSGDFWRKQSKLPQTKERRPFIEKFPAHTSHFGSCKADFQIVQFGLVYNLCGFAWAGQVSVHWPKEVDSNSMNKMGNHNCLSSSGTEYLGSPCKQMASRRLSSVKCGPLVHHGKFISTDKFLPGVHIKWNFLLWVHRVILFILLK